MTDHTRLRELAQAATPGPWHADQVDDAVTEFGAIRHWEVANEEFWNPSAVNDDEPEPRWIQVEHVSSQADAEFIAAANPTVVLALLDELEDTRAAYQLTRHQLDAHRAGQGTYEGITR